MNPVRRWNRGTESTRLWISAAFFFLALAAAVLTPWTMKFATKPTLVSHRLDDTLMLLNLIHMDRTARWMQLGPFPTPLESRNEMLKAIREIEGVEVDVRDDAFNYLVVRQKERDTHYVVVVTTPVEPFYSYYFCLMHASSVDRFIARDKKRRDKIRQDVNGD